MELKDLFDGLKPPVPVEAISVPGLPAGVFAVHEDYRLEDTEHLEAAPHAIRSNVALVGIDSFTAYVNKFKDADSLLFINPDISSIGKGALATAVLDYHRADDPRWGRHTVTLSAGPGKVYEKLMQLDKRLLDQNEFSKLIEELAKFTISPPAADLLEICRTLRLSSKGDFKSAEDDVSGSVDFVFNVAVNASAGSEDKRLVVPQELVFRAAPIDGMPEVEVPVKFIYRVPEQVGGKVQLGIQIIDRAWLEKESLAMVAQILTEKTELLSLVGTAIPVKKAPASSL